MPQHHYGRRNMPCKACKKLMRAADVNAVGICLWCAYDRLEDSPASKIDALLARDFPIIARLTRSEEKEG